ncbi:MAG: ureidoglycolate lyase [Myxococcaceae bacterium]|jgi:ureidoglycolate lyase|nr:ureidoglycolate lyase [Myxococcaceae bacterium]
MSTVRAEPLSVEAFAPFGDVVSAGLRAGQSANQGTATRFDWCTELVNARAGARANVSVFRSVAKTLPFELKLLEHHPCSTQAFLPMVCQRFLVCVAPTAAGGGPEVGGLRAFVCGPGQGINYRVGTWHHPIVALGADADFVMLAFEDGSPQDCVVQPLVASVRVVE